MPTWSLYQQGWHGKESIKSAGLGYPAHPTTMGESPVPPPEGLAPTPEKCETWSWGAQSDDMFNGTEIASKKKEV